ncbi:MAG: hypothetical protein HY897_26080 [Deltaproteobacteria bacterium]|nr:hypothetical protein [Deltaproteobacteria bacterium]
MAQGDVSSVLVEQLRKLGPQQQRRVLDFARALVETGSRGVPGRDLLGFAGAISPAEADAMNRAVEEACEKVSDEW